MQDLLFLEPIFHEKIWGGKKLKEQFNYDIPSKKTGECWAISAHKNGDCIIKNGHLKGKHLSTVYREYKHLFNNCESEVFPLLTKILDASDDLSVQVHPDNEYALKHQNDLGKTECWYVLACEEGAEIIYGHHAQNKDEFINMIENNEWNKLLRHVKIKPGDFFYVPTGTLHALGKGTLILETQQSSDTTYRVFDYHRKDDKGQTRDLHIKQVIDVTNVPHKDVSLQYKVKRIEYNTITTYIKSPYFTVEKWDIIGPFYFSNNKFILTSVLNGKGSINNHEINKGDHFIITSECKDVRIDGNLELMISYL